MSLQRLATIAEFSWLAAAVGAYGAALAVCLAEYAAEGTSDVCQFGESQTKI